MTETLETLLLIALPASGKSELRRYLGTLDREVAKQDLNLGPLVQLDDYPYVHMMRRIDEELRRMDQEPVFFTALRGSFKEGREWGMLIHLLNEDYASLGVDVDRPDSAALWLFDRYDQARRHVDVPPVFEWLEAPTVQRLAEALEGDAASLWADLATAATSWEEGSTVVIEFARGGPDGAGMPLSPPHGYLYSLSQLSERIRAGMSILYIWVTPEQSRRMNSERARPGREGDASILFHGVPEEVMYQDYGSDDFIWLLAEGGGRSVVVGDIEVPATVFDNRADHTSFLRADSADWPDDEVHALHEELKRTFRRLMAGS